jgi:large subunit ribosomal protein L33
LDGLIAVRQAAGQKGIMQTAAGLMRTAAVLALFQIKVLLMRDIITLACKDCKQRNYTTTKNKRTVPHKLELKKYCRFCRTHTLHKETK